MVLSMTGYGSSVATYKDKKIHVEVKSLNSKSLDLSLRMAPSYREHEMDIRQMVASEVVRGKVDFALWIEKDAASTVTPINPAAVKAYYEQIRSMVEDGGIPEPQDYFTTILRLPDVILHNEPESLDDEEWVVAQSVISEALRLLSEFRRQEGAALEKKFNEKVSNIANYLKHIEEFEQERVEKIKGRLRENLQQIPEAKYDTNRLEQELIYYIEKLDISEEKQRLANHLDYFRQTMADSPGQGKKLGFIAQEMGREINTTGSKSNHAEMQNLVVMMKDELEQIKEQVLNVL